MAKLDVDILGTVRATRQTTIPPGKTVTVKGLSRAYAGLKCCRMTVFTEDCQCEALPGGLRVIPSALEILPLGTTSRIFVEIMNTSSKPITIPRKYTLCQLQQVEVVTESADTSPTFDNADDIDPSLLNRFSFPEDKSQADSLKKLLLK